MTSTALTPSDAPAPARSRRDVPALAVLGAGSLVALVLALLVGDRTTGTGMAGMSMTHYMGLLSVRQPWNLLLFMALPVVLAETLAITELVVLFNASVPSWVRGLRRWAGLLAGPVWVFIVVHLVVHAVWPLSVTGGWRGPADVIAVVTYLLGSVPVLGISLVEAGVLGATPEARIRLHVTFVAIFLVVSHVAMIFGMLDPTVLGWHAASSSGGMGGMAGMPGMDMPSATPGR